MAERMSLRKKFPGKHVTRCTVWMPSGASLGFEGWISKEVAEVIIALQLNPDGITPAMRTVIVGITKRLTAPRRRKEEANG